VLAKGEGLEGSEDRPSSRRHFSRNSMSEKDLIEDRQPGQRHSAHAHTHTGKRRMARSRETRDVAEDREETATSKLLKTNQSR
jgi:hypothetical protein